MKKTELQKRLSKIIALMEMDIEERERYIKEVLKKDREITGDCAYWYMDGCITAELKLLLNEIECK